MDLKWNTSAIGFSSLFTLLNAGEGSKVLSDFGFTNGFQVLHLDW